MRKGMLYVIVVTVLTLLAGTAAFSQQIQCPGNTQFVSLGDTTAQVLQRCGQPKRIVQPNENVVLWTYSLMTAGQIFVGYSVLFRDHKVIEIVVNRLQRNFFQCKRGPIGLGSTLEQVRSACGQPSVVQNVTEQAQQLQGKITHFIYQPQSYLPETVFIFKDGHLVATQ